MARLFLYLKNDRQQESTKLTTVDTQLNLPIRPRPLRVPQSVPMSVVMAQPTRLSALKLTVQASGLTDDQVAAELKIDKGQWSRIMGGASHFPTERYAELYDICGNHILLSYDLFKQGLDPDSVRPLVDETEKRLNDALERIAEMEKRESIYKEVIQLKS